jgi:hypothetical protein
MIAVADVLVIGIGNGEVGDFLALDVEELIGLRHRQRVENEGVDDSEDDDVGADGHSERENGEKGESGRASQLAQGVTQVGKEILHGWRPMRLTGKRARWGPVRRRTMWLKYR